MTRMQRSSRARSGTSKKGDCFPRYSTPCTRSNGFCSVLAKRSRAARRALGRGRTGPAAGRLSLREAAWLKVTGFSQRGNSTTYAPTGRPSRDTLSGSVSNDDLANLLLAAQLHLVSAAPALLNLAARHTPDRIEFRRSSVRQPQHGSTAHGRFEHRRLAEGEACARLPWFRLGSRAAQRGVDDSSRVRGIHRGVHEAARPVENHLGC